MTKEVKSILTASLYDMGLQIMDAVDEGWRIKEGWPIQLGWQYEIIFEREPEAVAAKKPGRPASNKV